MTELHVAVGVIVNASGQILITRRARDSHQGGLWEFPGGKVEPGEGLAMALGRELREELGLEVERTSPLIQVRHDYGDKQVLLDVHVVWEFSGEPIGLEGQPLAWIELGALQDYNFPAANLPIVKAIESLFSA